MEIGAASIEYTMPRLLNGVWDIENKINGYIVFIDSRRYLRIYKVHSCIFLIDINN